MADEYRAARHDDASGSLFAGRLDGINLGVARSHAGIAASAEGGTSVGSLSVDNALGPNSLDQLAVDLVHSQDQESVL
jgi:hypothetical protein